MASSTITVADTTNTGLLHQPAISATTGDGFRPSLQQALVMTAIVALTIGLTFIGIGKIARPLYVVLVVMAAGWYYRRSPWLYVTLTMWIWTISPFVRRVIDFHVGFDQVNIVLVAPNLACLFMLKDILGSRSLLRRPEALVGLMLVVPALYGLAVNLVQGQIFPGAVAASDWMVPLLYYFFIIDKAHAVRDVEQLLRWFITLNGLVIVGYGFSQVWHVPAWDFEWARASGIFGTTELTSSTAFRPFGTLNSRGPFALWLGAIILLSLSFRTRLTPIVLPATCLMLALTFVRSVTGGVVLGALVAGLLGGRRMVGGLARLAAVLIFVGVIAASFDPTAADDLSARFGSLGQLQQDDSALARTAIWAGAPALIDAHPFGMGIGALGRGAEAVGASNLVNVDSGPLSIYLALGWVAGSIYMIGMLAALGNALFVAARLRSPPVIAFAATVLCTMSEIAFTNIDGFSGVVLWLPAGFAMAYGIQNRMGSGGLGPVREYVNRDRLRRGGFPGHGGAL
jgi:hypothetical protein